LIFYTKFSIFYKIFDFWYHFQFFTKFSIFDIIFNFLQNFQFFTKFSIFWQNFQFFDKIFNFLQNFQFFTKCSIFYKIFNFLQNFQVFTKFSIFDKIFDFWQNFRFLAKIFIFYKKIRAHKNKFLWWYHHLYAITIIFIVFTICIENIYKLKTIQTWASVLLLNNKYEIITFIYFVWDWKIR